jgi:hypothetical protein
MGQNIFQFLLAISFAIALLFLTIAGILYLVSSVNEKLMTTAKDALKYTLFGFAGTLLAWVLVNSVAYVLGYKDNNKWWSLQLTCTIKEGSIGGIGMPGLDEEDRITKDMCEQCHTLGQEDCKYTKVNGVIQPNSSCEWKLKPGSYVKKCFKSANCDNLISKTDCEQCEDKSEEECTGLVGCVWDPSSIIASLGNKGCKPSPKCSNLKGGFCNAAVQAAAENNPYGLDPTILCAILSCGEGCNPSLSADGFGSCGYSQALPRIRKWCGLTGTDDETCKQVQTDVAVDVNCAAKLIAEDIIPRCGLDIRKIASTYNSGKCNNCPNTTNKYCDRVENCGSCF